MKQKLFYTAGLIISVLLALAVSAAVAQTVANGPYYAPPSWDQTLPSSTRFIVLSNMASDAVLDRETGLVFEKTPSTAGWLFADAKRTCANAKTGGRTGWRLPSFHELMSLGDPASASGLPPGHPFVGISTAGFWTATTAVGTASDAWIVDFGASIGGPVRALRTPTDFGLTFRAWCVRSGGPLSAY